MKKINEIEFRQYELIVNSANKVSEWRQATNKFYLTVNTAVLGITAYLYGTAPATITVTSVMGILISILWHENINYYRRLNEAKFKVIHEIEKKLPFAMFKKEYNYTQQMSKHSTSRIECWIPRLFIIAYVIALFPRIIALL